MSSWSTSMSTESNSFHSVIADRGEFWWDPKRPDDPVLWDSKIRLGEDFFNEIIRCTRAPGYEHPEGVSSGPPWAWTCTCGSPIGLFALKKPVTAIRWRRPLPPVRGAPLEGGQTIS